MYWLEQFLHLSVFDWLFSLLFVALIAVGLVLVYLCKHRHFRWYFASGFILILSGFAGLYSFYIEPNWLVTRYYQLDLPQVELDTPIKIVVIGDMQAKAWLTPSWTQHLVRQVNQTNPDYIYWAGDLLEATDSNLDDFSVFKDLRATREKVAVLGNHDYRLHMSDPINYRIADEVTEILESSGFKVLSNDYLLSQEQGASLLFVGAPDKWAESTDHTWLNMVNQVTQADINIFLSHQPAAINDNPSPTLYDITLSGHCHGGQVNLPFLNFLPGFPHVPYGCFEAHPSGYFEQDGNKFLVTPGVGSLRYRMRFLRPPEISVLELY